MGTPPGFRLHGPAPVGPHDAKSNTAHLSEAKRQLLKRYLGRDPRGQAPKQTLASPRPPVQIAHRRSEQQLVRLRELSLEDYPHVAALESQYGLAQKSYEQWSHIWVNNPVYRELRKNWPIGWVLENEKKQIVGSHENIPLLYEFKKRRIVAAAGRGMVADSCYRGYALWLLMALFEQKGAELCFDTTPSYETAQYDEMLGAFRVPVGAWDRNVFWITNYHGSLLIWLKGKMPKEMAPLARLLSYPLAPTLFVKDMLATTALRRLSTGSAIECCSAFDQRFDEFWEDLRAESPDLLLAVRTRDVLQWHFTYALLENRLWIWRITRGSRMAAYAIFLKTENPKSGFTRVSLVDFQALGANHSLLLPMLSVAIERCRRERVHFLENVGFSFEKSGINNLARYRRKGSWWTYFYKARGKDLAETLTNPAVWAPSLYDGDVSIL